MRLEKPIIFFDVETTGIDTEVDRIVELACIKYNVDGTTEQRTILVNPGISIPLGASEVHGITDEMVKDKPKFSQYAVAMRAWFDGCDLGGFNSNTFDIPLLSAEFERAGVQGIDWNPNLLDGLQLYRKLFPNTLSDVYKRLTGKELEGAHGALADIEGTKEVIDILIPLLKDSVEDVIDTVADIDLYLQGDKLRFDLSGKMYKDVDGIVRWSFSKNKDNPVLEDSGFASWFLKQPSFPKESKDKLIELQQNKNKHE